MGKAYTKRQECGILWADMARGSRKIGTVREREGADGTRYFLDFGRKAKKLYSYRGVRFETREMAEGLLRGIEVEVAKGAALEDVLSDFAPKSRATTPSACSHWSGSSSSNAR